MSAFTKRFVATLLLAVTLAAPAFAETMSFYMRNQQSKGVAIEMRGRESGMVWPGGDQVYFLEAGERKTVVLECRPGETVCWGAWQVGDDRVAFGVGPDDDRECARCCVVCVGSAIETIDILAE